MLQDYREIYIQELNHLKQLTSKATLDITILTALGGCILHSKPDQIKNTETFEEELLVLFFVLLIMCFLLAVACLIRTYHKHEIAYFNIIEEAKYVQLLKELSSNNPNLCEEINELIFISQYEMYISCAVHNRHESERVAKSHRELLNWLIVSFSLLVTLYFYKMMIVGD